MLKSLLLGCVLAACASLVHATELPGIDAASSSSSSRLSIPLVNEPIVGALVAGASVEESTFYECRPQHYNPPCRKISRGIDASGVPVLELSTVVTDYAQLRAAVETAYLLTPILVGETPTAPTEACANTHGASGCCRIVYTYDDSTGTVYVIECGNR